jgi:hypothetical protein
LPVSGIDVLTEQGNAFRFGEPAHCSPLGLDPNPERCCRCVETRK